MTVLEQAECDSIARLEGIKKAVYVMRATCPADDIYRFGCIGGQYEGEPRYNTAIRRLGQNTQKMDPNLRVECRWRYLLLKTLEGMEPSGITECERGLRAMFFGPKRLLVVERPFPKRDLFRHSNPDEVCDVFRKAAAGW